MYLSQYQAETIVSAALSHLNRPYSSDGFNCVDFVRMVYRSADIEIPLLMDFAPPPEFNIQIEEVFNPPSGHLMFLKDRNDPRKHRAWTHVVIVLDGKSCIHNSRFYGQKVLITLIETLWARYDFVQSNMAAVSQKT